MKKVITFLFIVVPFLCFASPPVSHTIYFDSGSDHIHFNDKQWIDSVASVLKTAVNYSVSINGYCDADGSSESNDVLAQKRAAQAKEIFLNNKINEAFVKTNFFGENKPVAENNSVIGKAKNRRVEISVVYQLPEKSGKILDNELLKTENVPEPLENIVADKTFSSEQLTVGKTLILKNMNFEGGTPVLLPESEPVLKELLQFMKQHPTLEIEIGGHVCCGPDRDLSIARAKKVYMYLKGYGIDPKRMSYKGYSFDKPIAEENTEEGRIANRRVEITILKL
jgi:outer membrane protein OmpA-like peptidoglycan-associated protein